MVEINVRPAVESGSTEPTDGTGELIGTIGDVTERVETTRSLAQRTDRLRLLSHAAENLLRGAEPDDFLERFLSDTANTLGLQFVERFDVDDGGGLRRSGAPILSDASDGANWNDIAWELAREAVSQRAGVVRNDIAPSTDEMSAQGHREGIASTACFPLMAGTDVLGAVASAAGEAGRFDDDLVDVLRTIVDYVAVAEQRLRTEAELGELNQDLERTVAVRTGDLERREDQLRTLTASLVRAEQRERERIADVLHDDLQQLMYSAQMRLGLVEDRITDDQAAAVGGDLSDAVSCLEEGIALARRLTVDLAPPELDGGDLSETITWMADQLREMHGLTVTVEMERSTLVVDDDARTVLYRIVRELLFNVVKHAETDSATIRVRKTDGRILLSVSDGGNGFDVSTLDDMNSSGRGLLHIRHRVELIGGDLEVRSDERGTDVRITVPDHVTDEPDSTAGRE